MLGVTDVAAGYGRGVVLHDVSFSVAPGEVLGVLGRNGMGKTTLIRVLAGLLRPRKGSVHVAETDVTREAAYARAGHGVAVVPQGVECSPS
jgi:ABC-type branched-subunit amino acid transport system ATPase component